MFKQKQMKLLAACAAIGSATVLGGWGPSAHAAPAAGVPFKLVTETRPSSVEKFFAVEKAAYELCASSAKFMKLPVKPLAALPADFVTSRETFASDGKRTTYIQLQQRLDTENNTPKQGCATKIVAETSVFIYGGGKNLSYGVGSDGKRSDINDGDLPPRALDKSADYVQARQIKGVAVQCASPALLSKELVTERCVASANGKPLLDAAGRLAPAYERVRDADRDLELRRDPVSLQVGGKVDPALFNPDTAR